MLDYVADRLADRVPVLRGRIYDTANLAELQRTNKVTAEPVAAHVIPLGFTSAGGESASVLYTQMVDEAIGVLLTFRDGGPRGERIVHQAREIILEVIHALAGSGPEAAVGVLVFRRAVLVTMNAGAAVYQIDFAIRDQLRITP